MTETQPPKRRLSLWIVAYIASFAAGAGLALHVGLGPFPNWTTALGRYLANRAVHRAGPAILCLSPEELSETDVNHDLATGGWIVTYAVRKSGFEGAEVSVHVYRDGRFIFAENEALRQAWPRLRGQPSPCGQL